jgi:hypothetical protein
MNDRQKPFTSSSRTFIIGTVMSRLLKSTFLAVLLLFVSVPATAQPKPETVLSPPNWILGEWANMGGSEPNKVERIAFSEHEIELVQSLAGEAVKFSRKFRKYQIQESSTRDTYRIVISNSKEEYVYDFKLCSRDTCNLTADEALSYSVTKNKKKLWDHSTSFNKVLVKRSRGTASE